MAIQIPNLGRWFEISELRIGIGGLIGYSSCPTASRICCIVSAVIRRFEDSRAGDDDFTAGLDDAGDVVGLNAAVDLDKNRQLYAASMNFLTSVIFGSTSGMKAWPPKPGKTVIMRIISMSSKQPCDIAERDIGINGNGSFGTELTDFFESCVRIGAGVRMDRKSSRRRL